jgi:hypothetical protein
MYQRLKWDAHDKRSKHREYLLEIDLSSNRAARYIHSHSHEMAGSHI